MTIRNMLTQLQSSMITLTPIRRGPRSQESQCKRSTSWRSSSSAISAMTCFLPRLNGYNGTPSWVSSATTSTRLPSFPLKERPQCCKSRRPVSRRNLPCPSSHHPRWMHTQRNRSPSPTGSRLCPTCSTRALRGWGMLLWVDRASEAAMTRMSFTRLSASQRPLLMPPLV